MKRKLVAVMTVIAISMGLLACGSKDAVSQDVAEVTEEESTPEEAIPEEKENTEVSEEPDEKAEIENEEIPEQKEDAPIWYMDEEGLKSEELGIKIRRDSAEWESFGLSGTFVIEIAGQDSTAGTGFGIPYICTYYEGDLDSFISEYEGNSEESKRKKATIGNVSYASGFTGDLSLSDGFTFVGNGISFSISFMSSGYVLEDIWENNLCSYEEENTDYLAYIRDNTVYCPVLNIKFSSNNDIMNTVSIVASDGNGLIEISNDSAYGTVEELFKQFTETRENYGETAIDGTIEKSLGKHQFTGKGFANSDGGEAWAFYSDETNDSIYISIINKDERKVEDYLSLIEELQ